MSEYHSSITGETTMPGQKGARGGATSCAPATRTTVPAVKAAIRPVTVRLLMLSPLVGLRSFYCARRSRRRPGYVGPPSAAGAFKNSTPPQAGEGAGFIASLVGAL